MNISNNIQSRNQKWFPDYTSVVEIYRDEISKSLLPNGVVLHFGAGKDGMDVASYVIDCTLVSLDVDYSSLEANANKCKIHYNGKNLPFFDNAFDYVITEYVFEHLEDPEWILKELNRCMKPGAFLIFLCPNKYNYISLAALLLPYKLRVIFKDLCLGVAPGDVYLTYYRLNSIRDISETAEKTNFNIEWIRSYVGCPDYWVFSDVMHRVFVVVHKIIEHLSSKWHISLLGMLRKKNGMEIM